MTEDEVRRAVLKFLADAPDDAVPKCVCFTPAAESPPFYCGLRSVYEAAFEDWDSLTARPDYLELSRSWGQTRAARFWWVEDPSCGRRAVARYDGRSGFSWLAPDGERSPALRAALLAGPLWDGGGLAALGLDAVDDASEGEDGGVWLVADEAKFAEALAAFGEGG